MDMQKPAVSRPVPGLTREAEEAQLARIIGIAQANLEKAEKDGAQLAEELHELMETYGTKDKEALSFFHNTQSRLRENQRDLIRCRKARRKPYFGRIDFRDPKLPRAESYYVGRVGISENSSEPAVIDWRAPVASVYYENAMGRCSYTVKGEGRCEIDLKRKRTYEIADDRLLDFYDSDVVANDELLTKYLARNKSAVLGEIIATIQKEQNAVIRRSPKMNLIVQGAAGSGKTTVAMHRISYILYNYEEEFRPEDFYIIGSNRILLNYITSVLPDLDVYGVPQMTMEQLFVRLLYEDWDPQAYRIRQTGKDEDAVRIKGSCDWFRDLEKYCEKMERETIPAEDIILDNGVLIMRKETVSDCLDNNPLLSVQEKINLLNSVLKSKLENEITGRDITYPPDVRKELFRKYRRHFGKDVWKGSIWQVYGDFLNSQESKGKPVPVPEHEFDLYDLAALASIYKRIKETDGIREASHVIIDEAQDFGMTAYASLYYCLRGCTYTIMGDVSQNIHYGYGLNDWEELRSLMLNGIPDGFAVLKKSYRNTVEISDFAAGILKHGIFAVYPADPIRRHGKPVTVTECRDKDALITEAVKTIRRWQSEGRETIAVICRDDAAAENVNNLLGAELTLADTYPETAGFTSGIMVLPVEYTKGLEFDAVLLYDPTSADYPAEDAYVKLLYVAATRALHELTVLHTGDLTGLIAEPAPEREQIQLPGSENMGDVRGDVTADVAGNVRGDVTAGQTDQNRKQTKGSSPEPKASARTRQNTPEGSEASNQRAGDILKAAQSADLPVNPSLFRFGSIPDVSLLKLGKDTAGRSCDLSIREIRRTRRFLDLISADGTLRLTPVHDAIIRVQFRPGNAARNAGGNTAGNAAGNAAGNTAGNTAGNAVRNAGAPRDGYWNYIPEEAPAWTARAGKSLAELATEELKVQIDKRSGAIRFLDKNGRKLLTESRLLPRLIEPGDPVRTWNYFDWPREENLYVKGILAEDRELVRSKARYISFGGKIMRMPLVVSEYGYGLGIAADETVMCCDVPVYGTYLYTEGTKQIDYYFLYGGNYERILRLYNELLKRTVH